MTQNSIESEIALRTSRLVSNTRRAVSFFLEERRSALDFIVRDNSFEDLNDPERLQAILNNLKSSFGGFTDLGVIDPLGYQRIYVGPYRLEGVDYSGQAWYREVLERGVHISDVFPGISAGPPYDHCREARSGERRSFRAEGDPGHRTFQSSHLVSGSIGGRRRISDQPGKENCRRPSLSHGKVLDDISLARSCARHKARNLIETKDAQGQAECRGIRLHRRHAFHSDDREESKRNS